jgi:D-alanine-D-alanine ligase
MHVLVLHSDVAPDAAPEELDTLITSRAIADALTGRGHTVSLLPVAAAPGAIAASLRDTRADVVFNMVESWCGRDNLSAIVPTMLESAGLPYTGSPAASIALAADKPLAKRVLRAAGLPTPDWAEPPIWEGLDAHTRVIVKSATEDASRGLEDASVVAGRAAADARAHTCRAQWGGRWFAEAFVEGREFNVAALEVDGQPRVLPIQEMCFENWPAAKPRIISYRAKWHEDSVENAGTVRAYGLEREEPALAAALGGLIRQIWPLFGLRGYVRVDFRVDAAGRPMVLEVNPNPCLEPESGFAIAAGEAGLGYGDMLDRILDAALAS